MAATPKKAAAASASIAARKKRPSMALTATAVLIASVCGAVAAALLFYSTSSGSANSSATVAAATGRQYETSTRSASLEESAAAPSCKIQQCKAGGSEVCGTDGKTYLNECFFQNAQCKNATLDKVADWKGYNCPHTCTKKISCFEVGKFLCASDGNVYFGYCNLYIAQCLDDSVKEIDCDTSIFEGVLGK